MVKFVRKFKILKSKLEKIFRITQQLSFCVIVLIVALFYFDETGEFMGSKPKNGLTIMIGILIISNVGLEFAMLIKSIFENFCKKKSGKKLNQVEPQNLQLQIDNKLEIKEQNDQNGSQNQPSNQFASRNASRKNSFMISVKGSSHSKFSRDNQKVSSNLQSR